MKIAVAVLGLVCVLAPAWAQSSPQNIVSVGVSTDGAKVAGTGMYARLLTDGTYAFTVADFLPTQFKPILVEKNVSAGIAKRLATIGPVSFFVPASAGLSITGSNKGWVWTTGGLAELPRGEWRLQLAARVVKSSVNNNTGYRTVLSLSVGWGR